jgi:hypothetical protein
MVPDLTEDNYDALHPVTRHGMPGVTRDLLPEGLEQLADRKAADSESTLSCGYRRSSEFSCNLMYVKPSRSVGSDG